MGNVDWMDVAVRTLKTAVAAFLSAVPLLAVLEAANPEAFDLTALGNLGMAGLFAAGASVVTSIWNTLLQWSSS